jgi:hypothetical protein
MNRFRITFTWEQTPKEGPWKTEWDERDVKAAIEMAFYSATGGVSQRAVKIHVKRVEEKDDLG